MTFLKVTDRCESQSDEGILTFLFSASEELDFTLSDLPLSRWVDVAPSECRLFQVSQGGSMQRPAESPRKH